MKTDVVTTKRTTKKGATKKKQVVVTSTMNTSAFHARMGDLEKLKEVYGKDPSTDSSALNWACKRKDKDMVKWLLENGCALYQGPSTDAASRGDLKKLRWLHAHQCLSTSPDVSKVAALFGKLEVLKYLERNGYPIDEMACVEAADHGHFHVVDWLAERGLAEYV